MTHLIKLIRKKLKHNQFIYFSNLRLTNKDYNKYRKDMANSNIKSKKQIKREMDLIQDYWKCKPLHYIRYQLYNKQLSEEELLDYIPPFYHYNFYNEQLYQHTNRSFYSNKINLYNIFSERDIPTPKILAIIHNHKIYDLKKNILNINDILSKINDGEKIFFKPVNERGGIGIFTIKKLDNRLILNGQEINMSEIVKLCGNKHIYIIQKGIIQRSDLSKINPTSVNTLRAITQWKNGEIILPVCVLRIGRNGRDIDNSHQGGISIQVNVKNGELAEYCTSEHGGEIFYKHPDTGIVFKKFKIEKWDEIKTSIINFAKKIPELPEIAWDIAITDDGAEAIELNLGYGITHLQCCCGGLRQILNIYPDYKK